MVSVGRLTVRLSGHNRFKLDTCSSNNNLTSEEDAATSISSANNVDESMPPAKMNNYGTNLFLVPADNLPPEFPVAYANGSDDSSSSYGDYDNDSSEEPPQFPGNLADVPAGVFDDDRRLFVNGMAVDRYDFTHNMNAFLPPEEDEGPNPLENIN
ncbi:hypothetical protein B1987_13015 [Mycobacterium kansasii]|nr:hypothetical protein B1987_13015 [Mycobacterium kansasii]